MGKLIFTDERLLGLSPGRYTDALCRGLRLIVTPTSARFEARHPDGHSARLGEFVRPIPHRGDAAFARHMSITAARTAATERRQATPIDPAIAGITFRQDCQTYLAAQTWKERTRGDTAPKNWTARMNRHCAAILDRPTAGLITEDIAAVIKGAMARREIRRHGKYVEMATTARYLRYFIGQVIDFAMHGKDKDRWPKGAASPMVDLEYHVTIPKLSKRRQKHHASMRLVADEHGPGIIEFYTRLALHPRRIRSHRAIRFLLFSAYVAARRFSRRQSSRSPLL